MNFLPIHIKEDLKCFSDWFGVFQNGLEIDFGMVRIHSDWIVSETFARVCTYIRIPNNKVLAPE